MSDTKKSKELAPGADVTKINPLIDAGGDTSHVESVLSLLSFVIFEAADSSLNLDYDHAHGLAFMLHTCEVALKTMREGVNHGA